MKESAMKRAVLLACVLAATPAAMAQLYKWVDKDGRTIYSDQPPPSQQSKQLNLSTGQPAAAPRSALDRDKELEKARQAAKDKSQAAEKADLKAEIERENCRRAKANLNSLNGEGRVAKWNEKGERVILDDAQLAAERANAQKAIDEACKSS